MGIVLIIYRCQTRTFHEQ
uniref:Uncharacterized protein n=1 Tax=Arundo donax TaxID=35708 RepID=A0A0A9C0Z6_ARUDO